MTTSATVPLVRAVNLSCVFDVSKPWLNRLVEREPKQYLQAVDDVSFEIKKGETLALVGESGSGKSTIAKMLVGLLKPSDGSVVFDSQEMKLETSAEMRDLRKRFQMIFQSPFASLNPRWKVRQIISEPMEAFAMFGSAAERMPSAGALAWRRCSKARR